MKRWFNRGWSWLRPKLGQLRRQSAATWARLQEHYALVTAINQVIFDYNARVREAKIELQHANLAQVFDRECKDFMGTWAGLFKVSKEELQSRLAEAKQDLEDYNRAFSKMGEARRAIAQTLREQRINYLKRVKEMEKAYKKIADR